MKRKLLFLFILIISLINSSCAKPDYKKIADDFIKKASQVKNYSIRSVEDTNSADWKAVVVYVKENTANVPVIIFVSRDGKSVVPNSMVFAGNKPIFEKRFEPELGRIDFKPADKDRFVFNPSGKKLVYMFFDPDCPYCKKAREKLNTYNGEYRVVLKYFPLEQIHPGATQKAIDEEAGWLKKSRKDITKEADIIKEAKRMVDEDIAEAQKAGLSGVPAYVMEDGTIKQGLF